MPLTQANVATRNILLGDGVGTTVAPGSYFGFGQSGSSPASTGPRLQAGVGNPNGVVTAPAGSSWIETVTGVEYVNANGASTWSTSDGLAVLYDSGAIVAPAASLSSGTLLTGFKAHFIFYIARTSLAADAEVVYMRANVDAVDANYANVFKVQGAASATGTGANPTIGGVPAANTGAGIAAGLGIIVPYPESTTLQKWATPTIGGDHRTTPGSLVEMRHWRHASTAAISSYTFLPGSGGSFVVGTHFVIYGIA